ncbi:hypothetical protein DSECCO2_439100 [anaerobic digester metagenome]
MDIKTVYAKLTFLANNIIESNVFYGMSKEDKINFYNAAGKAVEKQMPKKPKLQSETDGDCPICNAPVRKYADHWCYNCGQKLDWEA